MAARARLLLRRAEQVVTITGPARARVGAEMNELGILPHTSVVVGDDGRIVEVSSDCPRALIARYNPERVVNCEGKTVFPGFVDAHTHTVHAGDRRYVWSMYVCARECVCVCLCVCVCVFFF